MHAQRPIATITNTRRGASHLDPVDERREEEHEELNGGHGEAVGAASGHLPAVGSRRGPRGHCVARRRLVRHLVQERGAARSNASRTTTASAAASSTAATASSSTTASSTTTAATCAVADGPPAAIQEGAPSRCCALLRRLQEHPVQGVEKFCLRHAELVLVA